MEMKGTMETLVKIAQKQGWKQLFSGLSINYLKVVKRLIHMVYSNIPSFMVLVIKCHHV